MIMNKEILVNNELPIITEYNKIFQNSDLEEVIKEVQKNNPIAMYELARRYQFGESGAEKNTSKAMELYKKILHYQRNTCAMYRLAYAYLDEEFGEDQRVEGIGYYEAAVELGDADAAVQLGIMYEFGDLIEQDYEKALKLYEFSVEHGRSDVYYNIGEIYRHKGMWAQAIESYEKAINAGALQAALPLGIFYEQGIGVEENAEKAFELYSLAHSDEDPEPNSAFFLGTMYYLGKGTEENEPKAFQFLKEASDQNDERANLFLGDLYRRGISGYVEKDLNMAMKCLSQVDVSQEPTAWYIKGLIYLELKDDQAVDCFRQAADGGNDNAKQMMKLFTGEEINIIENEIPDLVKEAIRGNEKFCKCLAVIYMGDSSFGPDFYDFEKMKFWTNRCMSLHTSKGDLCYAECLSRWAKVRRKNRIYDSDVLSDLQKSNEILLQLKDSGKCNIDEINAIYYQNEWEMGWVICYSNLKDAANLSKAYSYFKDVCENYLCSDALHGMAVVSLFKDDTFGFAQYTAKALEYDKWLDNEMYANCLHNMGGIFLAQTNSKDNLENAYQHFSKAAELGYEDSKKELSRFHRTFLGKLKYE